MKVDLSSTSRFAGKPGSIHAHNMDFTSDAQTFDENDMPDKTKKIRESVVRSKRKQYLNKAKPQWNDNTMVHRKFPDRPRIRELSEYTAIKGEYNYRADRVEKNPGIYVGRPISDRDFDKSLLLTSKDKKVVVDKVIHSNDRAIPPSSQKDVIGSGPFDLSIVVDRKAYDQGPEKYKEAGLSATAKFLTEKLKGAKTLVGRERDFLKSMREKLTLSESNDDESAIDSEMDSEPYYLEDGQVLGKPKYETKRYPRIQKQYYHTGVWEFVEREKGYVWSCCMSTVKNHPGCSTKAKNLDRWTYSGPP